VGFAGTLRQSAAASAAGESDLQFTLRIRFRRLGDLPDVGLTDVISQRRERFDEVSAGPDLSGWP